MTQTALLYAAGATAGDSLGSSLSISGDIVVGGAQLADGPRGELGVGAAYVYVKPPGGWVNMTQTAKLTPSDGEPFDWFGSSIDVDGDTVVVGSPNDDALAGSAYVFVEPESGWVDASETAKLTATDAGNQDMLGDAVAISGGLIIAGSPGDDGGGGNSGAGYLFVRPRGGWISLVEHAKLTTSTLQTVSNLGNDFAADIQGSSVALGAFGEAYVYRLTDCNGNEVLDACEIAHGASADRNRNGIPDVCECLGDTNGDGEVNVEDLVNVIVAWGPADAAADVNDDGSVDVADLVIVLLAWGACPG
jgi:hypothetical protein